MEDLVREDVDAASKRLRTTVTPHHEATGKGKRLKRHLTGNTFIMRHICNRRLKTKQAWQKKHHRQVSDVLKTSGCHVSKEGERTRFVQAQGDVEIFLTHLTDVFFPCGAPQAWRAPREAAFLVKELGSEVRRIMRGLEGDDRLRELRRARQLYAPRLEAALRSDQALVAQERRLRRLLPSRADRDLKKEDVEHLLSRSQRRQIAGPSSLDRSAAASPSKPPQLSAIPVSEPVPLRDTGDDFVEAVPDFEHAGNAAVSEAATAKSYPLDSDRRCAAEETEGDESIDSEPAGGAEAELELESEEEELGREELDDGDDDLAEKMITRGEEQTSSSDEQ
eukprot:TRINITY_DN21891_c0_g1_i2.p1 TRINITY_DN21891_c0_g1~~TRINITY_DN21891_c0_g1_i2.p1  ORF type:complete len:356 (+),score=64.16 TRINITY_DN21891_c0_g1_i2:62-1069(+)